jgi:esterase
MMTLSCKVLGEGQPLVILHGLFGSGDNWLTHAKALAGQYKVILVDQRNHGHSPHSDEMNYDLMANDLFELFAAYSIRDALLIGHSMGGKSILRFAQEYPFLVAKMIVVDMGIKQYPPHHDAIFQGLFAIDVENCPSRNEAADRLAPFIPDQSTRQFLLKNLFWKEPDKLSWRFNLTSLHQNIDKIIGAIPLEKITTDTLFLTGGMSNYVLDEDIADIRQLVPHSDFVEIKEAGHWVHAETPDSFMNEVRKYFG